MHISTSHYQLLSQSHRLAQLTWWLIAICLFTVVLDHDELLYVQLTSDDEQFSFPIQLVCPLYRWWRCWGNNRESPLDCWWWWFVVGLMLMPVVGRWAMWADTYWANHCFHSINGMNHWPVNCAVLPMSILLMDDVRY